MCGVFPIWQRRMVVERSWFLILLSISSLVHLSTTWNWPSVNSRAVGQWKDSSWHEAGEVSRSHWVVASTEDACLLFRGGFCHDHQQHFRHALLQRINCLGSVLFYSVVSKTAVVGWLWLLVEYRSLLRPWLSNWLRVRGWIHVELYPGTVRWSFHSYLCTDQCHRKSHGNRRVFLVNFVPVHASEHRSTHLLASLLVDYFWTRVSVSMILVFLACTCLCYCSRLGWLFVYVLFVVSNLRAKFVRWPYYSDSYAYAWFRWLILQRYFHTLSY